LAGVFSSILLGITLLSIGIAGGTRILSVQVDQNKQISDALIAYTDRQRAQVRDATMEITRQISAESIATRQRVREALRMRTHEAAGIARNLYETYKDRLPREDLEDLVRTTLRGYRFNDGRGYIFAVSMAGTYQMHPLYPALERTDVLTGPDTLFNTLTRDFLTVIQEHGEGYHSYQWPHPKLGTEKFFEKIAYVMKFEPFDWYLGSGEYVIDMERTEQAAAQENIRQFNIPGIEHIFATRWDGQALIGPAAGANILNLEDVNGFRFIQAAVRMAKDGGGFLKFDLPEGSLLGSGPHLTYVRGLPNWQWYVGASISLDTLDAELTTIRHTVAATVNETILQTVVLMLVAATIASVLIWRGQAMLQSNMAVFADFFRDASRNAKPIDLSRVSFSEFATLAESANDMIDALGRTQATLLEAQQSFELTVKGSGDAVWLYDVALGEAWMSRRCTEMLGFDHEEMPNTFDYHLSRIHPDDRERVRQAFDAHIHGDVPLDTEYRLLTKQGRYIWVRSHGGALRDASGKAIRIGGSTADITDRREAQERLWRNNQLLESVLENSPALIYAKDREGRYTFVNREWETRFRLHRESVIGRTDMDLFREENARQCREADLTVMSTNQPLEQEFVVRQDPGDDNPETVFLSLKVPLLGPKGQAEGVCGIATDITERKRMEHELSARVEELAHARRMALETMFDLSEERKRADTLREHAEAANRSKSAFLAAMSHEIRTPMNGVVGMIDLLRETPLTVDQQAMMNTVRESAFSLVQIINDILDHSKIEAGHMSLESIPISIRDTVEGVVDALLVNADKKQVRLSLFLDPAIPPRVLSDQLRLRQILFNLVGNAIKFTQTTEDRLGRIHLSTTRITPPQQGTVGIAFEVRDNGIGMSEDTMARLFHPFMQADQSTTRRFGGTGLGLSICQTLTDMMGGSIDADSTEGQGSTFTVRLTLPVVADAEPEEPDLSGLTIGCLTGDTDDGEILRRYCEARGAEVTCLTAPADAILAADTLDVLLVTDAWGRSAQKTTIAKARDLAPQTRFVALTTDRSSPRGLLQPDTVAVEINPIRRSTVLRAVAVAAGRASPDMQDAVSQIGHGAPRAPTVGAARAAGHLILVAEDNIINQDVIRRQVNLLGYACEVANDGLDALRMIQASRYAMLLTDCHMPRMDGFELTNAIRDQERTGDGTERLPIVAITANALQGEANRCLAAGMDDYLAKPLEMSKLRTTLAKWMPADAKGGTTVPQPVGTDDTGASAVPSSADNLPAGTGNPTINPDALAAMFGDDTATIRDVLNDFITPAWEIVAELRTAVTKKQVQATAQAAHKLRSAARAIGATDLADLCQSLETAAKDGGMAQVMALMPSLDPTFAAVEAHIDRLRAAEDDAEDDSGAPVSNTGSSSPSESPGTTSPVIDDTALKTLFGSDTQAIREVLIDFLPPSRTIVEEVTSAMAAGTSIEVTRATHKLKSSARTVGAETLASLSETMEDAGKRNDWETLNTLFPQLRAAFSAVECHIRHTQRPDDGPGG